jgi:hypothetical protein
MAGFYEFIDHLFGTFVSEGLTLLTTPLESCQHHPQGRGLHEVAGNFGIDSYESEWSSRKCDIQEQR